MNRKIAETKKNFSEMILKANKIYKNKQELRSPASAFDELRLLCSEEDYEIVVPERRNRNTSIPV